MKGRPTQKCKTDTKDEDKRCSQKKRTLTQKHRIKYGTPQIIYSTVHAYGKTNKQSQVSPVYCLGCNVPGTHDVQLSQVGSVCCELEKVVVRQCPQSRQVKG